MKSSSLNRLRSYPRHSLSLFTFTLLAGLPLFADTTVPPTTVTSGQTLNVQDAGTVTTSGTVNVQSGGTAILQGGTAVKLNPGFHAATGSHFSARIALIVNPTVDTDKDGLPDNWETAFGLNPDNIVDAGYIAAGGAITNLQAYSLGLNPITPKQNDSFSAAQLNFAQTQLKINKPQ